MFYQSFGPLVTLPTCCMASEITKIISVSLQSSVYVERLRHALRAEFQHHGSKVIPAVSQGKTSSSKKKKKADTQPNVQFVKLTIYNQMWTPPSKTNT